MTSELNELNKVDEIKSKFQVMYGSVKDEASSTLDQIQDKFRNNETDFREKLCSYVQLIKQSLKTLHEQPEPKIGDLRRKIEALVGEKNGCGNRTGKLVELEKEIRKANKKFDSYGTVNFMKTGDPLGHDNFLKVLEVERKVHQFTGLAFNYLQNIYKTQERLCAVLVTLNEDTQFDKVISEINELNHEKIGEYEKKIGSHESKLHLLNPLSLQKKPYEDSLKGIEKRGRKEKGLKDVTNAVRDLKKCVQDNNDYLDETFLKEVTEITDIQDDELDDITTDIEEIIDIVKLIQNFIHNTRLFFGYLNVFKEHKGKIEILKIEGTSISDIKETISSLEVAISTIEETISPIHEEKQKLEEYKETWGKRETRKTAMVSIRKWYFPGEHNLVSPFKSLTGCLEKLTYIQYFNQIMGAANLENLNLLCPPPSSTNKIDDLLISLEKMDICLSLVEKTIGILVRLIESSHKSNESNLNGTSIQGHLEEINQIHDKIAELHKSVRICINLTQIVSNVIGTLDNMKTKAGELKDTNDTVGNLRKNVEYIIPDLKHIYWNTVYIPNIEEQMRLYNINFATNKLKNYRKILDMNIR